LDIPSEQNEAFQTLERPRCSVRSGANERYHLKVRTKGVPRAGVVRAAVFGGPVIALILGGLYAGSYLVVSPAGLPCSLGLPPAVGVLGWILMVVGLAMGAWVFSYRRPAAMIVSTYATFKKMVGRASVTESAGRAEPLVIAGPQKYTRSPLYFALLIVVLGWALVTASNYALVWSGALLLWFWLVLIPFEEKELRELFGEQYASYARGVPMLVPFTKRRRR